MNTSLADSSKHSDRPFSGAAESFVDRRQARDAKSPTERRQFGNSYRELSSAGRELAIAIDEYKVNHRRRYITPDEMLKIMMELGYHR